MNTLLHKDIQYFWHPPSCSSGTVRKHAFMSIFVVGHHRIILTRVLPIGKSSGGPVTQSSCHLVLVTLKKHNASFKWKITFLDTHAWIDKCSIVLTFMYNRMKKNTISINPPGFNNAKNKIILMPHQDTRGIDYSPRIRDHHAHSIWCNSALCRWGFVFSKSSQIQILTKWQEGICTI